MILKLLLRIASTLLKPCSIVLSTKKESVRSPFIGWERQI